MCLDFGVRQQDDFVGELGGEVEVVQDHQGDEVAFAGVVAHGFEQDALVVHVERAHRFVKQEDFRVAQQDLREHDHLPLPAGEGKHVASGKVGDAEGFHHGSGAGELFIRNAHGEVAHLPEQDDFQRGERGIDDGVLRHVADGFAPGHVMAVAEGFVAVADLSAVGQFGKEGFDERGFACAVRPEDGVGFAVVQFERDVVGDAELAAMDGEVVYLHHVLALRERMIQKKNGTPMKEVMMPMGNSAPGLMSLERTEAAERKAEPASMAVGRK